MQPVISSMKKLNGSTHCQSYYNSTAILIKILFSVLFFSHYRIHFTRWTTDCFLSFCGCCEEPIQVVIILLQAADHSKQMLIIIVKAWGGTEVGKLEFPLNVKFTGCKRSSCPWISHVELIQSRA